MVHLKILHIELIIPFIISFLVCFIPKAIHLSTGVPLARRAVAAWQAYLLFYRIYPKEDEGSVGLPGMSQPGKPWGSGKPCRPGKPGKSCRPDPGLASLAGLAIHAGLATLTGLACLAGELVNYKSEPYI